jgi:hypothetical protein
MSKRSPTDPRQEPIGAVALCLAIILMVLPGEGELLWMLYRKGLVWLERGVWAACFLLLLTLVIVSWRRVHRAPARWCGRFVNVVTACILILNISRALVALHYHAL